MDLQPSVFADLPDKQAEAVVAGVNKVRSAYDRGGFGGKDSTGIFGVITADGKSWNKFSEPCHGPSRHNHNNKSPIYTIYTPMRLKFTTQIDVEFFNKWVDYIINRSFWKDTFFIQDIDHVMEWGVLSRCDVPANVMIGGIMNIRSCWERANRDKVFLWNTFVDAGIDEDIAYVLAHCFRDKVGVPSPSSIDWSIGGRCHDQEACHFSKGTKSYVLDFLYREPVIEADSFKEQWENYHSCRYGWSPVQRMWGGIIGTDNPSYLKRSWLWEMIKRCDLPHKFKKSFGGAEVLTTEETVGITSITEKMVAGFKDFNMQETLEWIDV